MLRFLTIAAVAAISTTGLAQQSSDAKQLSLTIGDKAPKVSLANVVKGKFDGEFKKGNVYVVEFWATWCGPCKTSMPHLTELQKEYKDKNVTIIGISDEAEKKVTDFITSGTWPQKTGYVIALDRDKETSTQYMRASGQRGIPTAFIVGKDGVLEWIGHPMGMDEPLAAVVGDTYDRAAAAAEFKKEQEAEAAMSAASAKISAAIQADDWDQVVLLVGELKAMLPSDRGPGMDMQLFGLLLTQANDPKRAYPIAERLIAENGDNAQLMNQLAWSIATDDSIQERDLDVALRAANAANDASKGEDPSVMDTLATVLAKQGKFEAAIKLETKALKMLGTDDDRMRADFETNIADWKKELVTSG